ncbi:PD-(D/E)XK nuclease family protein [Cyclobacterium sp. GBPx2]|uniref:PD-(D/E)XK nuclease family protein n=1 Tax=Cyclobacterium plantarum TaxID=2716263 RepID=A0ABX0H2H5_9BACT|nr:PD-(D/E)XK nuclease family protein [Cyclobacterium plantarum]
MNGFLKQTASTLLQREGELKGVKVILPNRRAGLFFNKYLGQLATKPIWMPRVLTIEDLFYEMGRKRPADKLRLIYEMYQVFSSLSQVEESFDRFYFWGEMILKDFNDLDQFLVNPEKLFTNLKEQKILASDWSFLNPEQVALIKAFWASFEERDKYHQKKFLKFWDLLHPLYQQFNARLKSGGLAYGGGIYREVVQGMQDMELPRGHHVFVGFNAFTATEERLIKFFIEHHGAEIFWDIDAYYMKDPAQEAGLFFREYRKDPVFGPTFPGEIPQQIEEKNAQINTYSVPLKSNQANVVAGLLEQVMEGQENWEETVVILPEEQLLFPILNLLPEKVNKVNVTMGYPVKQTPVYTFLEAVLELQRYTKVENGEVLFYHKPVKELLHMVYLREVNPLFASQMVEELTRTNTIYQTAEKLSVGGDLFALVFQKLTPLNLLDVVLELIRKLGEGLDDQSMEQTYLLQCYKQMNRLKDIFEEDIGEEVSVEFFIRIFRQVFGEIKLPFQGEPLEGIQLMGVLESRNLDFKRVIVCNMNEGSFPPSNSMNSMVPFNLRRAFGMPVQEQNDAIYAYTFYRLLHQAEEVHLLYTTAGTNGQVGEKSRYIHQLQIEMDHGGLNKDDKVIHVPVNLTAASPISIPKNATILRFLNRYTDRIAEGQEPITFSPSAINIWLDCRLKFYLTYIAGLEVPEEVQEEVDPAIFGNLVHLSLENLYGGYLQNKKSKWVEADDIVKLKDYIFPAVEKAILSQYFMENKEDVKLSGQLTIARDVLQKYLSGVLEKDAAAVPFEIISLEAARKYKATLPVKTADGLSMVSLGGIIDRVDKVNDSIRLIDYKSGGDKKDFKSIESLFDRNDGARNKAAMQTFFYGLLYEANFPENRLPLKPALFNLREIFKDDFNPYLQEVTGRGKRKEVSDYAEYRDDYVEKLRLSLEEIFDPDQSFDQTEDHQKCQYCPFSGICCR